MPQTPHRPGAGGPTFDEATLGFLRQVFHWVRTGDEHALAPVLAAHLPPNLRNEQGDSLLILAAYHGHAPVVRLLLEAGADPELVNDRGQTALGAAAFQGSSDIVHLLLAHGARVDSPPGGRTALMISAMFNRTAIMQLLRERGANPWARDGGGLNAFAAAQKMGADDAVELLRRWASG